MWDEKHERVVGFYGATSDITGQKRAAQALEESEARYRSLFENSPVSLWEEDYSQVKTFIDGLRASGVTDIRAYFDAYPEAVAHCASLVRILHVNQATLDLYHVQDEKELLGQLDRFLTHESLKHIQGELVALAEGATHFKHENIGQSVSLGGDPIICVVVLSIAPGFEESWERVFVSLLDITAQKQAEQQRLALTLEKERMQILSNFITQASHEFRTPLSTINTSTYMLKKTTDPEMQQPYILRIEQQVKDISTLVTALITMTHLDSTHELTTTEVDLCSVLERVYITTQASLQLKNLRWVLECKARPLIAPGNLDYLKQAIECIVDNAIRFSPENSEVRVCAEQKDGNAVIEIVDTGAGIGADDLPHIFERFYRADKAATTRGFGLGLPIARAIIELHQGNIEVESKVGEGSTFRICLPLA